MIPMCIATPFFQASAAEKPQGTASPLRGHLCVLGAIARTRRSRERSNAKTWENGGAGDTAVGSRPQRRWCERGSDKQWKGCIYLARPRNTYRTPLAQDGKFCFPKNEWRADSELCKRADTVAIEAASINSAYASASNLGVAMARWIKCAHQNC